MKRRGNRRYYQHHEVQLIRKIRHLLYEQGFTIIGARNKLQEFFQTESVKEIGDDGLPEEWKLQSQSRSSSSVLDNSENATLFVSHRSFEDADGLASGMTQPLLNLVRHELMKIRDLLGPVN
ncbi:hypothetical protein BH10PSE16_BH10PSE16_18230 [soil metagenome]